MWSYQPVCFSKASYLLSISNDPKTATFSRFTVLILSIYYLRWQSDLPEFADDGAATLDSFGLAC